MSESSTRRNFIGASVAGAVWTGLGSVGAPSLIAQGGTAGKLAVLGGKPLRTEPFPSWPKVAANDEKAWMSVLHDGKWCRLDGNYTTHFENNWAKMLGAKHCLATASGTTALLSALNAVDVAAGDEVIVPPYTFVATINVVLMQHALPVFVDTDRETFQIDANKIEAAITPRTRAIMPVHLGGAPADMDKILEIARNHKITVVEDACQAHLAEWRHKKVSTVGDIGCFSFQASKNLNSGEGGAVLTDNDDLYNQSSSFHNNGRGTGDYAFQYVRNGLNHRMTEFQGALIDQQLTRLEAQAKVREQNARYLTSMLADIQGIKPARMYDGCTRNAYHLYMFRYDPAGFSGLPRARFLKALEAEGIPNSGGYTPLNKEPFLETTFRSRGFRKVFSEAELNSYRERNQCPENDRLCEEAVWMFQTMLLGTRRDMDQIAEAIRKIQKQSAELAKS